MRAGGGKNHVHTIRKTDGGIPDVPGSILSDDTGPGEEVGLWQTLGIDKICWHRNFGIEVLWKVLQIDDFEIRPVCGGRGGGDGAWVQAQRVIFVGIQ